MEVGPSLYIQKIKLEEQENAIVIQVVFINKTK